MTIFATTDRLILREIVPEDEAGFYELDSNAEVHKYLGGKPVKSMDQIKDAIAFIRKQYIDYGIGRWAVIDKSTNSFVGWSGIKLITETVNNQTNYYDIGYRFQQQHWGKGYATETGLAALRYAFTKLGANKVVGIADIENTGSNKVLQKIGLRSIEKFVYDDRPHNWYVITKQEWLKQQL
jgi:[ribosomal protein S5]-alanine N-acetyltransferase